MGTVELKSNLHQLIDGIQNQELLQSVYELLEARKKSSDGSLWNSLTQEQKNEVLISFEESEKSENLISHSQVLKELK